MDLRNTARSYPTDLNLHSGSQLLSSTLECCRNRERSRDWDGVGCILIRYRNTLSHGFEATFMATAFSLDY